MTPATIQAPSKEAIWGLAPVALTGHGQRGAWCKGYRAWFDGATEADVPYAESRQTNSFRKAWVAGLVAARDAQALTKHPVGPGR